MDFAGGERVPLAPLGWYLAKVVLSANNLGLDSFSDPIDYFGGYFEFSSRRGVAGGEQVPPAPLCWYLCSKAVVF